MVNGDYYQHKYVGTVYAGWFKLGSLKKLLKKIAPITGVEILDIEVYPGLLGRKAVFTLRGSSKAIANFEKTTQSIE